MPALWGTSVSTTPTYAIARECTTPGDEIMAFDRRPLIRDIDEATEKQVAAGRKLEIIVSDARQVFPIVQGNTQTANLLLIAAGAVRFGQDGDNRLEDNTNESSEESEVDEDNPRTLELSLKALENHGKDQFIGSASFAALGNAGFTMDDFTLVAVDNADVQMTVPAGLTRRDLWFFSDVVARPDPQSEGDRSQLNRLGFQSAVLLWRPPGSLRVKPPESPSGKALRCRLRGATHAPEPVLDRSRRSQR
jgi:hypothetical protein